MHLRIHEYAIFVAMLAAASVGVGLMIAAAPALLVPAVASAASLAFLIAVMPAISRLRTFLQPTSLELLVLLLMLSGLVLRVRDFEAASSTPLDVAAGLRAALVAIVGAVLVASAAARREALVQTLTRGVFFPLFIWNIVCLVSVTWSINPGWSLYRTVEFGIDTALFALVACRLSTVSEFRRLFDWVWLLFCGLLTTVAVGVAVKPGEAILEGYGFLGISVQGVLPQIHRNGVGHIGGLLAVVAIARLAAGARRSQAYWGLAGLGTAIAILSQTRSVLLGLAVAATIALIVSRRRMWLAAAATVAVVVLAGGNLSPSVSAYLARDQGEAELQTLTGRTEFWRYAFERLEERPLQGFGAYAGGRFAVAPEFNDLTSRYPGALNVTLTNAHGTIPEIAVNTSFWGLAPILGLVVFLWWFFIRELRRVRDPRAVEHGALLVEAVSVLAFLTTRSLFTTTFVLHPAIEFLLLVAFAEFVRRARRADAQAGRAPRRLAAT
jgi:O-antigen ligase